MRRSLLIQSTWTLLLLTYGWFVYLMTTISLQYIPLKTDVAFLAIKQDYIGMTHYQVAFFIHVFTSLFVLPAGFTQFSKTLRLKQPKLHRRAGWIYAFTTLFLAGPSGLIIGIYANGGLPSRIAFCLLAVLWMIFTYMALHRAIQKKFNEHKAWMIRSFALALSAITLRAWKYILVAFLHPKPMDVYQVVAWLGWTLNLAIAEIIIYKTVTYEKKSV